MKRLETNTKPVLDEARFEKLVIKAECERDHLFFSRYFFKHRQNIKFKVNWHHKLICDTIEDVIQGRKKNVIITVSPGSSKTEIVVINLIARGLAINPHARFLHLSGSDSLASLNSATAREIVRSDEFQELWPLEIAEDANAKKRWNVMVGDKIAGGVYATSLGGQVTGFRAGNMVDGFSGCLIIDDPLKGDDAFSRSKIDVANRKLITTVKSRKATPDTPVILIMQRVSSGDCVDFILNGNLDGHWDLVKIPAVIDDTYVSTLPLKYKDQVNEMREELDDEHIVDGRFSYWPYKESIHTLLKMEAGGGANQSGQRISRQVFSAQYQQEPIILGGNIIKSEWFKTYTILPKIKNRKLFADTAQKTKEINDRSVIGCFGLGEDNKLYLLDIIYGRWEIVELERKAKAFWNKHANKDLYPSDSFGQLRDFYVEDASSGTAMIQKIKSESQIPIKGITRTRDKVSRVFDIISYLESGMVSLPEGAPFLSDVLSELEAFSSDGSTHDDITDVFADAVLIMLGSGNKIQTWERLSSG